MLMMAGGCICSAAAADLRVISEAPLPTHTTGGSTGIPEDSLAQVLPFYRMEKAGGFAEGDARGRDFVIARLAAGASELRDLYVLAWRDSADDEIGWPKVKVAEVEAGTADPWLAMYGDD